MTFGAEEIDRLKAARITRGRQIILEIAGRPASKLTKRQLIEVFEHASSAAPPRIWLQDKADIIGWLEDRIGGERTGPTLQASLREVVKGRG